MVDKVYAYYASCIRCGAEWHIETRNDYGKKHSITCSVCDKDADVPTVNLLRIASEIDDENINYSYSVKGPGASSRTNDKLLYSYRGWCSRCENELIIETTKKYRSEKWILCPFCIDFGHSVDLMLVGKEKIKPDRDYTITVRGPGARKEAAAHHNDHDKRRN